MKKSPKMPEMTPEEAMFAGKFPAGIVYADMRRTKCGDYVHVAFLSYRTLELHVYQTMRDDMRPLVMAHAEKLQGMRGQSYQVSTSGQCTKLGWGLPS